MFGLLCCAMPSHPIAAILFDLDGTLVDTERESAEAIARAMRSGFNIEIEQEDRDFIIGRSWVEIYRNLRERYRALSWSCERLIEATTFERAGIFAESGMCVLPGAIEAVERFAHLPRALVTGSSRAEAAQALEVTDLRSQFDVVLASEDVPRSKPDPAGYRQAAALLEVPEARCVVVEDSSAGIAAGIAAGSWVVGVRAGNFHGQDQKAAHRVIDNLNELTHEFISTLAGRGSTAP